MSPGRIVWTCHRCGDSLIIPKEQEHSTAYVKENMTTCAVKTCLPGAFWDQKDTQLDIGMCRVLLAFQYKFAQ